MEHVVRRRSGRRIKIGIHELDRLVHAGSGENTASQRIEKTFCYRPLRALCDVRRIDGLNRRPDTAGSETWAHQIRDIVREPGQYASIKMEPLRGIGASPRK